MFRRIAAAVVCTAALAAPAVITATAAAPVPAAGHAPMHYHS